MNTLIKKAAPLALAVLMVFGGFVPTLTAHAANTVGKTLVVKKTLTLAASGVTTPSGTVTFTATKVSLDGVSTSAATSQMPALTSGTVTFSSSDTTDDDGTAAGKQVIKGSTDMLDNVTFTQAGQYVYTVTETQSGITAATGGTVTYSRAQYTVSLFVVENPSDNFVVDKIMIKKDKNDDGNDVDNPSKVEYDPTLANNAFAFENYYDVKAGNPNPAGTDPADADKKGLVVSKTVAEGNQTIDFGFSLTLTRPEGAHDTTSQPTAKIVNASGTAGAEQNLTYGTAYTFNLKHGERLVLNNVLLGSNAKVEETNTQGYVATVSAAAAGGAAVTSLDTLKDTGVILGDQSGGNYAAFTNTEQTPTGLIIANLPFIILFVVAVLGIALFVRNRRRAYDE